uniref:Uncharacterized protein n=1 Tax=Anguilla anguilla TaxID=7936 RepID=A0A0E9SHZ1_ANGAN
MFSLKLKGTLFWLLCAVFIIAVYTSLVCWKYILMLLLMIS